MYILHEEQTVVKNGEGVIGDKMASGRTRDRHASRHGGAPEL